MNLNEHMWMLNGGADGGVLEFTGLACRMYILQHKEGEHIVKHKHASVEDSHQHGPLPLTLTLEQNTKFEP